MLAQKACREKETVTAWQIIAKDATGSRLRSTPGLVLQDGVPLGDRASPSTSANVAFLAPT